MSKEIFGQINRISMELRLPAFRNDLESVLIKAATLKASYEQLILELLQSELETRLVNRKKAQLRNAGFPQFKHLQDLVRSELPTDAMEKLPVLESLNFIASGQNVILGGSPGTGKTHIAIGNLQPWDLKTGYRFIRSIQGEYHVQLLCEVLEVSRSCYYALRNG